MRTGDIIAAVVFLAFGIGAGIAALYTVRPENRTVRLSVECVQASGVWIVSGPDAPYCQRGK